MAREKIGKVVLAYSGGLDTSVILKWLQDTYDCEVVTFTADIGQGEELAPARAKARKFGVKRIFIEDLREEFADPMKAAKGADLITTDVWTSMGDEAQSAKRKKDFEAWRVDAEMMKAAKKDALFMHCLPAHRGEEVAAKVIDGPQSVVWDEAENRLHVQKALMEYLLLGRIKTQGDLWST